MSQVRMTDGRQVQVLGENEGVRRRILEQQGWWVEADAADKGVDAADKGVDAADKGVKRTRGSRSNRAVRGA